MQNKNSDLKGVSVAFPGHTHLLFGAPPNYVLSGRTDYCVDFAIHLPKSNIKKFNKSVVLKTGIKSINNKQTHARCKRNVRVNCLGDIAP